MIERSAAAAMLRPVRHHFEIWSWGSPTTLWDPSSMLSKDLFTLARSSACETAGEGGQEATSKGA